jgi:hypothetical protein
MKLVRWEFLGLHMPMMGDDEGELYCTSKSLCDALGVTDNALWVLASRHAKELSDFCLSNCKAIAFLKEHKLEFGVKYIRGNMRLWSEDDMLVIASRSEAPQALEFMKRLRRFGKLHARVSLISIEEFREMRAELKDLREMKSEFQVFKEMLHQYLPSADKTASLAGSVLQAQKGTKTLRLVATN